MGYHDHRILKSNQKLLKPPDRFQIQMVRRLVKQQDVRIAKQSLRKKHLHLFRTGQLAHLLRMKLRLDSQSVQKRRGIRLRFPAVHCREIRLKLARPDSVLLRKILLRVDRFLLLHNIIQLLIPHNNRIQNIIRVILEMILLQEGESLSGSNDNIPLRRLNLSRQDLQERGLAGSVRSDQTIAVALCELYVDILEQCFLTNSQGHITCLNHSFLISAPFLF